MEQSPSLETKFARQLLRKFPAWVHYRLHNSPPLVLILSQMKPLHTITSCFF